VDLVVLLNYNCSNALEGNRLMTLIIGEKELRELPITIDPAIVS